MRADRLISIVMLLQTQELITAEELARELEVSTRTIYRDITALNVAGIPIYTDRGPGGGIALLESYRTTLTGMSEDEARALFMLSIPQALVDLGVGQKLKTALLKLAVALPPGKQMVQAHTQQRIYLDSTSWDEPEEPSPHLGILHKATWEDRLVRIIYRGNFDAFIEFMVEPLGLVAKLNTWYLVGRDHGHTRVFKIADIIEVELSDQIFTREAGFDLECYWKEWCKASQSRRPVFTSRLKVAPSLLSKLHYYLDEGVRYSLDESVSEDSRGWKVITIYYEHFFQARESILSFGRAAEVLEPEALRCSVIDFARQIVDFYGE